MKKEGNKLKSRNQKNERKNNPERYPTTSKSQKRTLGNGKIK